MLRRLYDWTLSLAGSKRAVPALAAVSFAESSFFPIPPDVLLVPMALANPKRAWYYATVCTIASALGGVAGWLIGYLLFETVGLWLINLYGYADKIEVLRAFYAEWGWAFVLSFGFSPLPYKLASIASGMLEYNVLLFFALSVVSRGARFFLLAAILYRWGDPIRGVIDKHFALLTTLFLVLLAGGFLVLAKLF
jgi:membrane protein YqaA with SNARE-associated domain